MYVLDTNVLSELIRRRPNPDVVERLRNTPPDQLFTSAVSVTELRNGAAMRDDFELFWKRIVIEILSRVKVLHLEERSAVIAGDILARLRKRGRSIGLADALIGAIALANDCAVVTGNRQHFDRIPGLEVEDWSSP
jgi:tRNA(fMet)-specific endonuclease VapC